MKSIERNIKEIKLSNKKKHVTEYFILILLLYNTFYKSGGNNKKMLFPCLLICFMYVCTDEFHQLFRERTGSFIDALMDNQGN